LPVILLPLRFLKIKAFLYALKTKSTQPPPGLGDQGNPPQTAELEAYWSDDVDGDVPLT
jgi:hypothetical protein